MPAMERAMIHHMRREMWAHEMENVSCKTAY